MPSTLAYVVGKMYLCTVEIQESVHGSLVAPVCTIKKIKSSPICLQLGLVLFLPSARFWGLEVCPQAKVTKAVPKTISGALMTWTTMTS